MLKSAITLTHRVRLTKYDPGVFFRAGTKERVNKGGSKERGKKKRYNKEAILNSEDTTCVYIRKRFTSVQ